MLERDARAGFLAEGVFRVMLTFQTIASPHRHFGRPMYRFPTLTSGVCQFLKFSMLGICSCTSCRILEAQQLARQLRALDNDCIPKQFQHEAQRLSGIWREDVLQPRSP